MFTQLAAKSIDEIPEFSNFIITADARIVRPGTHIAAVGANCKGKREIDERLFLKADICIVDSKAQSIDHDETSHTIRQDIILEDRLIELGELVSNFELGKNKDNQITICDLTNVGIQDIQITKSIWNNFSKKIASTAKLN